ncbi:MAG TPA: HNH endonuclease signature motif containing protein [Candidatus Elarobacter sp.]|jgi:5-methylcytosine-specific restriction endonuclease McrA|nr:HNH endonuclease signature motif containing protein [Candidatus Elarobacter sp.]
MATYGRGEKTAAGWYAIRDPKTRRAWRATLLEAQNGRCGLCGHRFAGPEHNVSIRGQFGPTFDHIVRYADGGMSDLTNLRLVHHACNQSRESGRVLALPKSLRSQE